MNRIIKNKKISYTLGLVVGLILGALMFKVDIIITKKEIVARELNVIEDTLDSEYKIGNRMFLLKEKRIYNHYNNKIRFEFIFEEK